MKLYLAGPMQGIPEFNYPAFHRYAKHLRKWGHDVFSPAERDIMRHGTDISQGNETGSIAQAEGEHGFDLRIALLEDLTYICKEAEGIAMMPGWERSYGARVEWSLAVALRMEIIYLEQELFGAIV